MVITQNLRQCHSQAHVVTVIIKKLHQLPMIKPSYHLKPMKATNQACPPGPEQSFLVTYPSENDTQKLNLTFTVLYNRSRL